MRVARLALALSTLLFVTSIWFVLAGPRSAAPAVPAPSATLRQVMLGLVIPASTRIYDAAGTVSTLTETVTRAPKDAREWEAVGASAAMLIEASQLLRAHGPADPNDVWHTAAVNMATGAKNVLGAAQQKDVDQLLDKGGEIVAACDECHAKYLPGAR